MAYEETIYDVGKLDTQMNSSNKKCAVLRLTLKKKWFDMIASGEKKEEYRVPTAWILSRLIGKEYDVVEFSNGYGKNVPRIMVEYFGWHRGHGRTEWGAIPQITYVVIRLGNVISKHNGKEHL